MKPLFKLALVFGLGLILASCGPVVEAHFTMSFEEVPGIQIIETRRLVQDNIILNWEVPVRYILEREAYVLHLSVSEATPASNIIVSVVSRDDQHIRIVPDMDRTSYAPSGGICADYSFQNTNHNELFFSWPHACSDFKEKMQLSIDLKSEDGGTVGKEVLPFEMKWDGFVYYNDFL